jgi:DNA processing protein
VTNLFENVISPYNEAVAYDLLWEQFRNLKPFSNFIKQNILPSEAAKDFNNPQLQSKIESFITDTRKSIDYSVNVMGAFQYPSGLKDTLHSFPLLYYQGDFTLLGIRSISIVGARNPSKAGIVRAERLAKELSQHYAIVSGLAKGIDTAALYSAVKHHGNVIGVIGTPINMSYPHENKPLQSYIAKNHLLITHVPLYHYYQIPFNNRRFFFPQRNELMSAISLATVIVEASDNSGTLIQARECLRQNRKLFILNSCFEQNLKWVDYYYSRGAIRVNTTEDILDEIGKTLETDRFQYYE